MISSPDHIVLDTLTPAVVEAAAGGGDILDGFPRTLLQASAAAELAARLGVTLDAVVCLSPTSHPIPSPRTSRPGCLGCG
ncbi:MAG: hypothetical protein ACLPKI_12955 [Streptosporangiaceae bacterium]